MRLIAVTTCTNRKRRLVSPGLDASSLPFGSQSEVAREWRKRLRAVTAVAPAIDLYCGRSFQEATSAARAGHADFRIISGGLGFIRGEETIPSYSLSLVRQSPEFIGKRVIGPPFDVSGWWGAIQQSGETSPLAKAICVNRDAIAVIGISNAYL